MALTKTTASSGTCIRDGRYTRSKVKANKQTKALEPVIGGPQVTLKQHIDSRIAADDAAIDARAEQDAREEDLQEAHGVLSAKLFGEGGSYDSDVYRAVFELAPSNIAVPGEDDRRKAYVDFGGMPGMRCDCDVAGDRLGPNGLRIPLTPTGASAQIPHRHLPRPPIWDASALSLAVARQGTRSISPSGVLAYVAGRNATQ